MNSASNVRVIAPARFAMQACSADFLRTARHGWDWVANLPVSANDAFDIVTDPSLEREWFPNYVRATWSGPPGVGVEREYQLRYMRIVERFTIWERGRHLQFWVSSSLPILDRFMEDYRFIPRSANETDLYWSIRYEPRRSLRALRPILEPVFARDFRVAVKRLESLAWYLSSARCGGWNRPTRGYTPERGHKSAPPEPRSRPAQKER